MDEKEIQRMEKRVAAFERLAPLLDEVENNGISKEEIQVLFEALVQAVDRLRADVEAILSSKSREVDMRMGNMANYVGSFEKQVRESSELSKSAKNDLVNELKKIRTEIKKVEALMPEEVELAPIEKRLSEIESVTQEDVIDRVNVSEKKIKRERVEGLDEELKRIESLPRGSGGFGVRRVFQPFRDDFSSLTDGATKIFYLTRAPLQTETVMVFGTDFPGILRPTIDFTIANKTLTLSDAVPAPSQGATLLCTYFS